MAEEYDRVDFESTYGMTPFSIWESEDAKYSNPIGAVTDKLGATFGIGDAADPRPGAFCVGDAVVIPPVAIAPPPCGALLMITLLEPVSKLRFKSDIF